MIFVHGCFWHRHNCKLAKSTTTRSEYWDSKFKRNTARDQRNQKELRSLGWRVLVVWECETKDKELLTAQLSSFLGPCQVLMPREVEH